VAVGPASLALWRSFAWTPQGSSKKGFVLSADASMQAQRSFLRRLSANEDGSTRSFSVKRDV
jgi:hypothetical protein